MIEENKDQIVCPKCGRELFKRTAKDGSIFWGHKNYLTSDCKATFSTIEDVEAALKGMLEPIYEEKVIGQVEIRQIFKASGIGNIAGCLVTEGRVTRDSKVRLTRDKEQIYEGPLASLKHFKDEVKEVKAGTECGIVLENFNDIQEGDKLEAYIMVEVPR